MNSHMQTALDHLQENLENSELVEYMKKQGVILVKICLKGISWHVSGLYIYFWGCDGLNFLGKRYIYNLQVLYMGVVSL